MAWWKKQRMLVRLRVAHQNLQQSSLYTLAEIKTTFFLSAAALPLCRGDFESAAAGCSISSLYLLMLSI